MQRPCVFVTLILFFCQYIFRKSCKNYAMRAVKLCQAMEILLVRLPYLCLSPIMIIVDQIYGLEQPFSEFNRI